MTFPPRYRNLRQIALAVLLMLTAADAGILASETSCLRFTRPDAHSIPGRIADWLTICKRFESFPSVFIKPDNRATYIYITYGVKSTGGYSVLVKSITRIGRKGLAVHVRFSPPQKGAMVTQQLTLPHDLVMIRDTGWTITVVPEGKSHPLHIAGLAGIAALRPVVAESRMIKIFAPQPGSIVDRVVHVAGVALVHEGTVQMRLSAAAANTVVAQTIVTTASGSQWGYFERTISIPDSVRRGTALQLELYTIDEEKGGVNNLVLVPLQSDRR